MECVCVYIFIWSWLCELHSQVEHLSTCGVWHNICLKRPLRVFLSFSPPPHCRSVSIRRKGWANASVRFFFFFPFLISIMMLSHRDSLRSFNSPISWRQNVSHLMWSEPCADQSWCDSDGVTAGRIWPSEAHDYEGHLFNESGSFIHSFSAIIATVYPVITLKACLQS